MKTYLLTNVRSGIQKILKTFVWGSMVWWVGCTGETVTTSKQILYESHTMPTSITITRCATDKHLKAANNKLT
jgi:hypothetical protein